MEIVEVIGIVIWIVEEIVLFYSGPGGECDGEWFWKRFICTVKLNQDSFLKKDYIQLSYDGGNFNLKLLDLIQL